MTQFQDVAPRLMANGYLPLPVHQNDKRPVPDAWTSYRLQPGDADRYARCSTGILCGPVVGIDIDIRDEDLSARIERIVTERFGAAPRRIGHPPKSLVLYRTDAPFSKIQTRGYRLPGDAPEGKPHKVEVLATGQQFVAYGVHPDTGREYVWNGSGNPLDVQAADLPTITEEQAKALISELDELMLEFGELTGKLRDADANRPHEPNEKQRGDPAVIRAAVQAIRNADLSRDDWIVMGMAIKGALGEQGRSLWLEWSRSSSKSASSVKSDTPEKAWDSFKPTRIGAGTLIYLARQHGWIPPAAATQTPQDAPEWTADDTEDDRLVGHVVDIKAPLSAARMFIATKHRIGPLTTLRWWQGQPYAWNQAAYVVREVNAVRSELYSFLDLCETPKGDPISPTKSIVDNVMDATRAITHLDAANAPAWLAGEAPYPVDELIACANGIVHVPTRRLLPPTPAFFNLNATTFDYVASAPKPEAWLSFLNSLWADDPEAIAALQCFMGLALTLDTSYQKALLIVGPKRSGKGTVARILTALVGPANTAAPTLAGLGGQFGLQALIGKQLAIISDARLGGRADIHAVTENLLRITGEDFIGVPRKHLADYTARLPVRFVIMTNEVPSLADSSGALPSRFVVLRLTRSFYGNEDKGLTDKLLAELPGIFLWALEGLDALRARGRFVQPTSGQAMLDQLDELASPIKAFLRERCIVAPGASIDVAYLFSEWQDWCRQSNREHPGTVQTFGRNLSAAVPGIEVRQLRVNGERVRHYAGVRLRSVGDPE